MGVAVCLVLGGAGAAIYGLSVGSKRARLETERKKRCAKARAAGFEKCCALCGAFGRVIQSAILVRLFESPWGYL